MSKSQKILTDVLSGRSDANIAVANAQIVIGGWIETAQSLGRPIPEPKGKLVYA